MRPTRQPAAPGFDSAALPTPRQANPLQDVLQAADDGLKTSGAPLDAATRADMEPRFGRDFSAVRVHAGGDAARSARALDARAYTTGHDLVFGAGQYAPHTAQGRRLLAHELAHVAQPRGSGAAMSRPGDASEREADRVADAVIAGGMAPRLSAPGATVQRQPASPGELTLDAMPPLTGSKGLLDQASPLLASAVGSTTLEGFDTGKAELKPGHQKQLATTAAHIHTLLEQYPLSTLTVTGYADTVDTEVKNLALGESRAATVRQALVDLGVPEAMIATASKGEGDPQAVKTRDETPNTRNRRVEVRFHPKKSGMAPLMSARLSLEPPGSQAEKKPGWSVSDLFPPKPPIILDDGPRPPFRPPQPDYFKPIPPPIKGSEPASAIDLLGRKIIDPVIDKVAGFLPKSARDELKDAARSGVKSGAAKGARAFAEAQGVTDPQALDAIENAVKAAIEEKGQARP